MINTRTPALVALCLLLLPAPLRAQDLAQYRNFALGSTVASVVKAGGLAPGDVKSIHRRPATIQELRWQPLPQRFIDTGVSVDPVRDVVFSFYNDQLFRIVVDYDRLRIEGLTDADLIETMTDEYGPPLLAATSPQSGATLVELDGDTVIARWTDATASLTLLRRTYPTTVRLVVALTSVDTLARTASADAMRQDVEEAPQRERDRQAQAATDGRIAVEKARVVNKVGFKP